MIRSVLLISGLMAAAMASAADSSSAYPLRIPAPGGAVVLPDAESKRHHDEWRFAAARRVGDTIYVSGVIVNRNPGEGNDVAALKVQARRALKRLQKILEAANSDFQHVVMINSFHVWQGPNFSGTRDQQFGAFEEVVDEFIKAPYPAWTAVGTTGLLSDGGIIEVQLIAKVKN